MQGISCVEYFPPFFASWQRKDCGCLSERNKALFFRTLGGSSGKWLLAVSPPIAAGTVSASVSSVATLFTVRVESRLWSSNINGQLTATCKSAQDFARAHIPFQIMDHFRREKDSSARRGYRKRAEFFRTFFAASAMPSGSRPRRSPSSPDVRNQRPGALFILRILTRELPHHQFFFGLHAPGKHDGHDHEREEPPYDDQ